MSKKTIQLSFFGLFTAGLCVFLFLVFKPYLGVIFISGVFAITFYPLYTKLVLKFNGRENLASLVVTLLILVFIIVPVIIISTLLLKEAVDLYNAIAFGGGSGGLISQADALLKKVSTIFPSGVIDSQIDLGLYARSVLDWIISHFDSIFVAIFGSILNFVLMLISLYYFFIYGEKITKGLVIWSPLPDEYDNEFIQTLKSSIDAVLRGWILISIVQGVLIGIGFFFFGVPSPVLWGFVGGVASLLPLLGTSIVTIPAVVYLFISGHIGAGIGLLIWGSIAVGLIDNIISVIFLKGKIKIHPLIILFSILGGVEMLGAIGFLIGPVLVSAFIALMKIYPFVMSYKKDESPDISD